MLQFHNRYDSDTGSPVVTQNPLALQHSSGLRRSHSASDLQACVLALRIATPPLLTLAPFCSMRSSSAHHSPTAVQLREKADERPQSDVSMLGTPFVAL